MAAQSVTGASPITFISEDTVTPNAGLQYQIPLSLISYDATQNPPVIVSAWPSGIQDDDKKMAAAIIGGMIAKGQLKLSS